LPLLRIPVALRGYVRLNAVLSLAFLQCGPIGGCNLDANSVESGGKVLSKPFRRNRALLDGRFTNCCQKAIEDLQMAGSFRLGQDQEVRRCSRSEQRIEIGDASARIKSVDA
jgi:hypothetical protein